VPPKLYGGTERVVSYITEELERRGHRVTLFASGDSQTSAHLVPGCPKALRIAGSTDLASPLHLAMLARIFNTASERFDIIHSHVDYWSFPFSRLTNVPIVSTMHGRLDLSDLHPVYKQFSDAPVVSISDAQRTPLPNMNWIATVHHGMPRNLLRFHEQPDRYLAFIGRISPEKGIDVAIGVSLAANIPLKIAAKVDPVDQDYFVKVIEPKMKHPLIEFIGEIDDSQKSDFLGNAYALLFSIDWPEPFGLAMIESLACGTPVIARPCGSVREIVRHGVTGLIAADFDSLVDATRRISSISRETCRREFEERFTSQVMVEKYERIYHNLLAERDTQVLSRSAVPNMR
jgi:glycosyltransferase involved in cell wall biosynthesis